MTSSAQQIITISEGYALISSLTDPSDNYSVQPADHRILPTQKAVLNHTDMILYLLLRKGIPLAIDIKNIQQL